MTALRPLPRPLPRPVAAAAVAATLFALGQFVLRAGDAPPPQELVRWESWSSVGEAPHEGPLLLEFTATWCPPCREMKLSTFRDPAFLDLLAERGLRPVRIETSSRMDPEFLELCERYRVRALPALVIVHADGTHLTPIHGKKTADEIAWEFDRQERVLLKNMNWYGPKEDLPASDAGLVLRNFDNWIYLPADRRRDWRYSKDPAFVSWANDNLTLVSDKFGLRDGKRARDYYTAHRIDAVPTMIITDSNGRELRRFEGPDEVAEVPAAYAQLVRERGLDLSDPPPALEPAPPSDS